MALELSTIGIKLSWCPETTKGTKPTTGWTEVKNITSIGELNASPEQLDVTDLSDTWRRYIAGVKSNSGSIPIGANFTKAFQKAWSDARTAYTTAFSAEKALWWKVAVPNFGDFYFSGEPADLGLPSVEVNSVFAGSVDITPNQIDGWTMQSAS